VLWSNAMAYKRVKFEKKIKLKVEAKQERRKSSEVDK
jgi:hypothetical protein